MFNPEKIEQERIKKEREMLQRVENQKKELRDLQQLTSFTKAV